MNDAETNYRPFLSFCAFALLTFVPHTQAAPLPERQVLRGHVPAAAAHLQPGGALAGSTRMNLAIGLPLRNREALTNLLQQLYDPASPNYRRFLTPEQFAARFGPTEQDYQAVAEFAKASGLNVAGTHPNRMVLDVNGPVAEIERALHVTMRTYPHPREERTFYAPDAEPSLDLGVPVLHISGLDNYSLPRPRLIARLLAGTDEAGANSGSGPSGTYMGNDFRAAYVPGTTLTGSGQTVGVLQFDGYTASDITYYEVQAGLPSVTLSNVLLDGFSGNPTGFGGEVEVSLDIEMALSMAPGLSEVIVYEAGPYGNWHDILNRMATDNLAKQLSCSWYIPGGGADPVADQIFQQMAAQGQSFFNASGDDDAYTGLIDFPGDTPYLTQVGGTTLSTTGPGGAWASETVWNWGGGIGSGGGVSTSYSIPDWQTNIDMTAAQGSTAKRNTPEVALTADNVYVRADGRNYNVGGTSCAAPLWAGFAALVNQQAIAAGKPTVGFVNPAIYALGQSSSYTSAFHDIATGNNTKSSSPNRFYAVAGYDLCTGWGTPAGSGLINALATPDPLQITPGTGFSASGGVGGPFNITSLSYSLTNTGSTRIGWALTRSAAWLSASHSGGILQPGGLSATVAVSLNGGASNLAAGNYTAAVWFTNLSDGVAQTRQFTLAVISPPAIAMQPTNQAVLEGGNAVFTVTATGGLPLAYQWQDNGTNLADGGDITGSARTNLLIKNASAADVGTYRVIVTNVAGSAMSSNAFLTITPSAPVIVTQPTNRTVVVGRPASFSVMAIGTTPLFYQWNSNGTNILGGTNGTLPLIDVQLTQAGTYTVVITNALGCVTSAPALLTVLVAPPCDPAPSGLVAMWEAEGDANDSIGTNNGTMMYGAAFTNGAVNQAFSLTGVGSCTRPSTGPEVVVPDNELWAFGTNDFSIELWANFNIVPNGCGHSYGYPYDGVFISSDEGSGGGNKWWFALDDGKLDCHINGPTINSGAGVFLVQAPFTPATNVWYHFAVTRNGNLYTIYTNGVAIGSQTDAHAIPNPNAPLTIGSAEGFYFNGLLDEVSIYKRALSSDEVAGIYSFGAGGKCPVPPRILVQPADQAVAVGGTATFSVAAVGTQPLSYQWSFNGTNITGGTGAALTLANVQLTNSGAYSVIVVGLYGSATSSVAMLSVGLPPTITRQPTNETVLAGSTASFDVGATSPAPPSYQWQRNGLAITNGISTNLTIVNAQTNDAGIYAVLVTNPYGSVSSSNAVLTVLAPPSIIAQPVSRTNVVGTTASFSVAAAGTQPLTYQWNFGGTNMAGATNATLTLTNVQLSQAGNYTVLVSNNCGSLLSSNATLTVNPPPPCEPAPAGLVAMWQAEGNANDSIGTNNGTMMYGAAFTNGAVNGGFKLGGVSPCTRPATGPQVVVPDSDLWAFGTNDFTIELWANFNVVPNNCGHSYGYPFDGVFISNDEGSGGGNKWWFALDDGKLDCHINGPAINGGAGVFLVQAPFVPKTNLWYHFAITREGNLFTIYANGVAIGSQTSTQAIPNPNAPLTIGAAEGMYFNGLLDEISIYSRALSSSEIAGIYGVGGAGKCPVPPAILTQPTNQTASVGGTAGFRVNACGTQPLFYQWSFSGTNMAGATNTWLTLTNLQPSQAGTYVVQVANVAGLATSSNAVLTVNTPPSITAQPTNLTVVRSSNATFCVTAVGSPPLIYKWTVNGNSLSVGTNASLTLTNLQLSEAGTYAVLVTNNYGSALSSNAVLVIKPIFHFVWSQIPSPRFLNTPFAVTVQAQNAANGVATNFTDTVVLVATNGMPVVPAVSGSFAGGIWTGMVVVGGTATNLVLQANDSYGELGQANPIGIVNLPALKTVTSGGSLLILWPVAPSGFFLETTASLSPAKWAAVATLPFQVGDQYLLPVEISGTSAYYRLRFSGP